MGAALAGLVDTHAVAMSIASLTAAEKLTPRDAVQPILVAMSCNALAKGVMAASAGSLGFALRTLPGLILSMVAAWSAPQARFSNERPITIEIDLGVRKGPRRRLSGESLRNSRQKIGSTTQRACSGERASEFPSRASDVELLRPVWSDAHRLKFP